MFYNTNFCVLQASFFRFTFASETRKYRQKDEKSIIITNLYLRFRYA